MKGPTHDMPPDATSALEGAVIGTVAGVGLAAVLVAGAPIVAGLAIAGAAVGGLTGAIAGSDSAAEMDDDANRPKPEENTNA